MTQKIRKPKSVVTCMPGQWYAGDTVLTPEHAMRTAIYVDSLNGVKEVIANVYGRIESESFGRAQKICRHHNADTKPAPNVGKLLSPGQFDEGNLLTALFSGEHPRQYNENWNDMMPVIGKIGDLGATLGITSTEVTIEFSHGKYVRYAYRVKGSNLSTLEKVHTVVAGFLKFWNSPQVQERVKEGK